MRKLLIIGTLLALLFSCKKEESPRGPALSPGVWLATNGMYQFKLPTETEHVSVKQSGSNVIMIFDGRREMLHVISASDHQALVTTDAGESVNLEKK